MKKPSLKTLEDNDRPKETQRSLKGADGTGVKRKLKTKP